MCEPLVGTTAPAVEGTGTSASDVSPSKALLLVVVVVVLVPVSMPAVLRAGVLVDVIAPLVPDVVEIPGPEVVAV